MRLPGDLDALFPERPELPVALRVGERDLFIGESDLERFMLKVNVNDLSGCWLWTAATVQGYGKFRLGGAVGQLVPAHRVARVALVGPIPDGLQLDHLCRVRNCVYPLHTEAVTARVNLMRSLGPTSLNARKTECKDGHPFDDANTRVNKYGKRECLICRRQAAREFQKANREMLNAKRRAARLLRRDELNALRRARKARQRGESA